VLAVRVAGVVDGGPRRRREANDGRVDDGGHRPGLERRRRRCGRRGGADQVEVDVATTGACRGADSNTLGQRRRRRRKRCSRRLTVMTSGYAMVVHGRPKTPKNTSFLGVTQPPGVIQPLYSRRHN